MKIKLTAVVARENTNIPWYVTPESHVQYMEEKYGNVRTYSSTESEDGLTLTTIQIFENLEAFQEISSDGRVIMSLSERQSHNSKNKIYLVSYNEESIP